MSEDRKVKRISQSQPTMEGAGVRLKRAFGSVDPLLDPFLLLDDFHSENPDDYLAGFPWHPHRGIETITYMLHGKVEHQDSLGNKGVITPGDAQWMTAGSGIIHSEMPKQENGLLWGFQLWANLPAAHKMSEPQYRDIEAKDIPEIKPVDGVRLKIVCGMVDGVSGPVTDVITEPEYLDISLAPGAVYEHPVPHGRNLFAYVTEGTVAFGEDRSDSVAREHLAVFGPGDKVVLSADETARLLLISGAPIGDPVAWGGPIVMNTREELETAFREYNEGTFLKHKTD
ncbi:pirin family protein [candidate division KSB1 bacterium]